VSLEEPLRVVVADDHPYYRRGLIRSLRARGIEVVAEAPNGEAAIRAVEETAPDVVVMDLKMPGMSGFEATRQLTARVPATRVLVLSVSNDENDVADAVLAGASGYVLKESPVDEVVAGIRAAASGESHISQAITTPLLRRLREPAGMRPDMASVQLSDRERELLDLLARGMDDEEIAQALGISTASVRRHASSILTKLVHAAVRATGGRGP
jgi:DNA-binding NarL/FixJ family response regulator